MLRVLLNQSGFFFCRVVWKIFSKKVWRLIYDNFGVSNTFSAYNSPFQLQSCPDHQNHYNYSKTSKTNWNRPKHFETNRKIDRRLKKSTLCSTEFVLWPYNGFCRPWTLSYKTSCSRAVEAVGVKRPMRGPGALPPGIRVLTVKARDIIFVWPL